MILRRVPSRILRWLVPTGLSDVLRRHRQQRQAQETLAGLDPALLASFASNGRYRDRHKGQRCFILATGPSIKEQNLQILRGEICIAVSHFFLHKDLDVIRPSYHVVAPYHPPFTFADTRILFEGLASRYAGHSVDFFFGYRPYQYSTYDFVRVHPEYRLSNTQYVNYATSIQLNESNFNDAVMWDITKSPFSPRTVIYTAMQLAAYMGCKEMHLLGCDHRLSERCRTCH